jgi:ATP synthase F1 gamma subunit
MPNLKEVRNRIVSVNSTQQITSAMKMVSAAKLRRAQDAITQMRPYAEKLKEILGNLSSTINATEGGEFSVQREAKKILIVAVTSNRGLAGAFNSNILKAARKHMLLDYYKIPHESLPPYIKPAFRVQTLQPTSRRVKVYCLTKLFFLPSK